MQKRNQRDGDVGREMVGGGVSKSYLIRLWWSEGRGPRRFRLDKATRATLEQYKADTGTDDTDTA